MKPIIHAKTELEHRAVAETKRYFEVARKLFNVEIPDVPVSFDIFSAGMAGQACYSPVRIRYNSPMMHLNGDDFINRTIPHEVAHIVAKYVYGRCQKHNPNWRHILRRIGGTDLNRCHTMNTEGLGTKRARASFNYWCGCPVPISVGPKVHANIQNGIKGYSCRTCRGPLQKIKWIVDGAPVLKAAAHQNLPVHAPSAETGTKKDRARALLNQHPSYTRGQMIELFMQKLEMGKAGASTYYQMLKSE